MMERKLLRLAIWLPWAILFALAFPLFYIEKDREYNPDGTSNGIIRIQNNATIPYLSTLLGDDLDEGGEIALRASLWSVVVGGANAWARLVAFKGVVVVGVKHGVAVLALLVTWVLTVLSACWEVHPASNPLSFVDPAMMHYICSTLWMFLLFWWIWFVPLGRVVLKGKERRTRVLCFWSMVGGVAAYLVSFLIRKVVPGAEFLGDLVCPAIELGLLAWAVGIEAVAIGRLDRGGVGSSAN